MKKLDKDDFIKRSLKIHNGLYDYSLVDYVNNRTPVKIICKDHGVFTQRPYNHLNGQGCPECSKWIGGSKRMESKKSVFVDRAMSCHGERYDYSKSNYLGARIPIEIICPIHGSFYQLPFNHIRGVGCPKCKADKSKSIKYGVGINDMIGMEKTLAYEIWNKMLARCYSEREQKRRPTYVGVKVCDDWLYFSKFKKWFDVNYKDGYELDKDILSGASKIYSPNTCCFVPHHLNSLLTYKRIRIRDCPTGVVLRGSRYRASLSTLDRGRVNIGTYDTKEEAYDAYKKSKMDEIRKRALERLNNGEIDDIIYNALVNHNII